MIRELIEKAKRMNLPADEVLEVHSTYDGRVCECRDYLYDEFQGAVIQGRTELLNFKSKWSHLPGGSQVERVLNMRPVPETAYVGIVHEQGVFIVPVNPEAVRN